MQYVHSLFLFRRDIRLEDNTALHAAVAASRRVSFGFIFDPAQTKGHRYRSLPAFRFLMESLEEVRDTVKAAGGFFNVWEGDPAQVLSEVLKAESIDAVFVNADYTPFSRERDERLKRACEQAGVAFVSCHDALLHAPGTVMTQAETFFKVFTPFYKAALKKPIASISPLPHFSWHRSLLAGAHARIPQTLQEMVDALPPVPVTGGRKAGLALLKRLHLYKKYSIERDIPAAGGTTLLSAHNKFGTVSIREVYRAIHADLGPHGEPLVRALYWRDFFYHVLFFEPRVLGHAFQQEYDSLPWSDDEERFKRWCEGRTGYPLVDAGMRQLVQTGFMHNRVRMVVASFLVKDLHIDWRKGERYFAQHLIDYDPAVNNGNWQWCASTGCDAQPYFRIFNPWTQQERFDPQAHYIRRWVAELATVSAERIHAHHKKPIPGYHAPMVDHAQESKRALALYKRYKGA